MSHTGAICRRGFEHDPTNFVYCSFYGFLLAGDGVAADQLRSFASRWPSILGNGGLAWGLGLRALSPRALGTRAWHLGV